MGDGLHHGPDMCLSPPPYIPVNSPKGASSCTQPSVAISSHSSTISALAGTMRSIVSHLTSFAASP